MKRKDVVFNNHLSNLGRCVVFVDQLPKYVMITRFNNRTYDEYERFHNELRMELREVGYRIYNTPKKISEKIELGSVIYVLEMNNDTNHIMGISLLYNLCTDHVLCESRRVYNEMNYNRYSYEAIKHKRIDDMNRIRLIEEIEKIVFKGKNHVKRGNGIERCSRIYNNVYVLMELDEYMNRK